MSDARDGELVGVASSVGKDEVARLWNMVSHCLYAYNCTTEEFIALQLVALTNSVANFVAHAQQVVVQQGARTSPTNEIVDILADNTKLKIKEIYDLNKEGLH